LIRRSRRDLPPVDNPKVAMTAIATTASPVTALPAKPAQTAAAGSTAKTAAALNPVDLVELSDRGKAIVEKAKADAAVAADLALTFDQRLQKRTEALTAKLTEAFGKLNVNLDEAVRLYVDKSGNVSSKGPWAKKIEKFFADNPDLAKEMKAITGLNALKAANTALDLYYQEKGTTIGSKQQQAAWTNYNIRSINVQALSGLMSLKDGKLRSAAVDYIDTIAHPYGDGTVASQKDIANRLA
jgi:hypothetical protein